MIQNKAQKLKKKGLVPDSLIRVGIRHLLRERLAEISADDIETFQRVQGGIRAAEPEWLSLHRDARRDARFDDRRTAIGTSELPQRAQLQRWRALMEAGDA